MKSLEEAARLNDVQKTIIDQLIALNPFFRAEYSIKNIVLMDENTIRLCMRGREHINVDLKYDRGQDLYNFTAYRLRNYGLDCRKIYEIEGIFWEQLDDILKTIVKTASAKIFD